METGKQIIHGVQDIKQQTTPTNNPPSGFVRLYPKSDGNLYILDENGVEKPVCETHYQYNTLMDIRVPLGSIIPMALKEAPPNWLLCDGSLIEISFYQKLSEAIYVGDTLNETAEWGYKCNMDDTRNTSGLYLKLPDLRGEFIRGLDNGRGIDIDRNYASSQLDLLKAHNHTFSRYHGGVSRWAATQRGSQSSTTNLNGTTHSTGGTETRPRNLAFNFFIKYKEDHNSFIIKNEHFFTNTTERDAYFVTNPEELVSSSLISVDDGYQQYNGTSWIDVTAIIQVETGGGSGTGSASIDDWEQDKPFQLNSFCIYKNLIFKATTAHQSTTSFNLDLENWTCISTNAKIVNKTAHGITQFQPVFYFNETYGIAKANQLNTCANYICLEANTDYFLIAESGTYNYDSHNLGQNGIYYTSDTISGELVYADNNLTFVNPVIEVLDSNNIKIISYKDVQTAITDNKGYQFLAKIEFDGSNEQIDFLLNGDDYDDITFTASTSSGSPTGSHLSFRFNNDSSNNYRRSYILNNSTTTVASSANTSNLGFIIGQFGNSIGVSGSGAFKTKLNGSYRSIISTFYYYKIISSHEQTILNSVSWLNTASQITSINMLPSAGFKGYIYLFGLKNKGI